MIYYLENGDMFLLNYIDRLIIFVYHSSVTRNVLNTQTRWKFIQSLNSEHIDNIVKYLQSNQIKDNRIGIAILQDTLKVQIHGDIVGYAELRGKAAL